MKSLWRDKKGIKANLAVLAYIFTGYFAGVYALFDEALLINVLGTVMLAHAMIIAAYFLHECAHNSIFKNKGDNARLGTVMMWITGSCYGQFKDIQHKHFRHHADKADVVAFDYRLHLKKHPVVVKIISVLEWFYIPAIEILMHALVIILPFVMPSRKHKRSHVIMVVVVRFSIFFYLTSISVKFAVLYAIAYMIFLTVMRFMDTHQHTYEIFETLEQERGEEAKQFDREYEHRNTFSNLISTRYPALNLLVLNFGFHNAHHKKSVAPWYDLPKLHKELFAEDQSQVFPFWNLLKSFHRYRVKRVLNTDIGDIGIEETKGKNFIGVDGVSFLTAH